MRIPNIAIKAIVTSYVDCVGQRQWDQVPAFFARDANWWINGNPARVSQAGDGTVAERLPDTRDLLSRFDTYSFDVLGLVAERDRIDVEAMATGRGPLDLVYVNNVTMSFVIDRDGKIATLREYPDYNELNWVLKWFEDHGMGNSTTR
ncbi:hypothetical protein F4781DRAFT_434779 [Annulohypoxylon bovei var. microspora]|nr:hypothetical protein F4781DRAFT_434779 [Annulohypoxylon bovei var. microspora]